MGISKCPFCHEPVEFERVAWVACGGCLARHHASCWTESPRCASCGDPRSLALPGPRRTPGRVRRAVSAFGRAGIRVALHAAPIAVAALWLDARSASRADAPAASREVAELSRQLEGQKESLDAAVARLASRVDRVAASATPDARPDRTDEVLDRIQVSDEKTRKRVGELSSKVDALGVEVVSLRKAAPTVVVAGSATGIASAIEAAETLKSEGRLSSSQRDLVKRGLLSGRVAPDAVVEVARLSKLKDSGMLSSSDFERAKNQLLDR